MAPSLYLSGWNPPRVKRDWDRCSMTLDSARHYLGEPWRQFRGSPLAECVAWFDYDGDARVVVGQYESGALIIVRRNLRSTKITFAPPPSSQPQVERSSSRDDLNPVTADPAGGEA